MKRIRLTSGITFSEVAVSSLLLAILMGMTGVTFKGRMASNEEGIALSSMVKATHALLIYAQDNHEKLPQTDLTVLRLLERGEPGPSIAANECVDSIAHQNPVEVVVLTAPVGSFEDRNGRLFQPIRIASTDGAAAKAIRPEPDWAVFSPQETKFQGAAPYGTTAGAIRVWHPASFRMTPIYRDVCDPAKVKGPLDRPTFVPAADAAEFYDVMEDLSSLTPGSVREVGPL